MRSRVDPLGRRGVTPGHRRWRRRLSVPAIPGHALVLLHLLAFALAGAVLLVLAAGLVWGVKALLARG